MSRRGLSKYRVRARELIHSIARANVGMPLKDQLKLIDAAYPFGARVHWPYKQWLVERAAFVEAASSAPSRDEAAVCLVAHDLVELGRIDEARALMDEQAPNRLKRPCPACGARAGAACRELLVPHEARLTGRGGSGPLFEALR